MTSVELKEVQKYLQSIGMVIPDQDIETYLLPTIGDDFALIPLVCGIASDGVARNREAPAAMRKEWENMSEGRIKEVLKITLKGTSDPKILIANIVYEANKPLSENSFPWLKPPLPDSPFYEVHEGMVDLSPIVQSVLGLTTT